MRGLARILRANASQGAGFLISPRHLNTCAHVVNLALGRDKTCPDPPEPSARVELDFPNDASNEDGASNRPRRIGRVVAWRPPTPKGRPPGPADDIAVLALDQPMPADAVPALSPTDQGIDGGTTLEGWGTPAGGQEGLWASATLSGAQGPLRQLNLPDTGPELQEGFSGGPLCAGSAGPILGMMVKVNDAHHAAWLLLLDALRRVWDELRVLAVRVRVKDGRLYADPDGPAGGTDLAWLSGTAEQGRGSALLDALFATDGEGHAGPLAEISTAHDANAAATRAPPRLRIHCEDVDSADLPWHIVADADGNRLGKAGWIVEVTGPRPSDAITVEIDTPLILAPGSPELAGAVHFHVGQLAAALSPLLSHHRAKVSWAVNARDLDDALARKNSPDLVYCYAKLTGHDELVLGRDRPSREALGLMDLLARLQRAPNPPRLLWLHLVADAGALRARRLILERMRTVGFPLCVLQVTSSNEIGRGLDRTLKALEALAACRDPKSRAVDCQSGFAEPAAVLSRDGDVGTRFSLGCQSLRLSPALAADEWARERIRSSLIQLLLGRTSEKHLLAGAFQSSGDSLLFYHVCGERQACVHDFPDQGRWHLEDVVQGLTVRQRVIPGRMRPNQDVGEFQQQLFEALRYDPAAQTVGDALVQLFNRREPNDGETLVVSLAWLLEPTDDLDADAAEHWLACWKRTLTDVFASANEIPRRMRVLAGVCLQWRSAASGDDWPARAGTTAADYQRSAATLLDDERPDHCDWIRIERPLDRLSPGEVLTFFQKQSQQGRRCIRGHDPKDLAKWVLDRTGGQFEPTVDLIYDSCKHDFAEARGKRGAAPAPPGGTQ